MSRHPLPQALRCLRHATTQSGPSLSFSPSIFHTTRAPSPRIRRVLPRRDHGLLTPRLGLRTYGSAPLRSIDQSFKERDGADATRTNTLPKQQNDRWKPRRVIQSLGIAFLVITSGALFLLYPTRPDDVLNPKTFTPYTITEKTQLSPTSFILTLSPPSNHPPSRSTDVYRAAWAHGTWSVEVKHPALQISRAYTPLPDPPPDPTPDPHPPGALRLLIRPVQGGDVSAYLAGLAPGDSVALRGPRLGFAIRRRLDPDSRHVVFLAGGTGVAPALQVAQAVLAAPPAAPAPAGSEGAESTVALVWASRTRADCRGCTALVSGVEASEGEGEGENALVGQLRGLRRAYGAHRVRVRCLVDEDGEGAREAVREVWEGVRVANMLVKATAGPGMGGRAEVGCVYHDANRLEDVATDPPAASGGDREVSSCGCERGRNLLVVSGPEGFIEKFAGRKQWAGGEERQGVVGGLIGELRRRYPDAFRHWLVLKL